ncbi:NADPH-glutathione reductase [Cognatiyoonia koreensis]|uniref:NADPH-glutathione reductase n=1 Tax=Cognatiyoonia koreensis TaxID=364200 RepID=A0A1I0Q5N8_9RHOB|nr:FAD-dependent oxidoreductase [Cognatiyoonia koreensis]SEW22242.1 NADPH-glutathione reductase [Cognatiyoonia koreensis]
MAFDYDLFVIGGGSGGVRAARVASSGGAKVALAEEYRMGGTCVIRGCVPKKLMVFASGYPAAVEDAQAFGWDASIGNFDWPAFRSKLHDELDRLEGVYRKLLNSSDVEIFDARATLKDAHTVQVGDKTVTAKHVLVATGGHPVRPDLPNADLGIVSNDIFLMEEKPKSILIIGGGYIACEFACILNGLGVEVTQYYRGAQILRGFDDEARGLLAESMNAHGIDVHLGTDIVEMAPADERNDDPTPTGSDATMGASAQHAKDISENPKSDTREKAKGPIWVKATNGTERVFDHVLFATGRAPNTGNMGLEEAGVELGRGGEVVVDEYSQSKVPSIYAIGDVTNRVQLTPVAIREAMAFVETVFKGNPTPIDHDLIPSAVFTQPELGTIGKTEEQARDEGPIEVYCTSFKPMQQAFAGRSDRVLMKLIVCQDTRKVLGCHIVAEHAGEMIQLAGIAVKMGATKEDFDAVVAVHPTMAEELVTMKEPMRTA